MRIPRQSLGVDRTIFHTEKKQPHRISVPAFINEEIGLGDVIKKVTHKLRLIHCDGCERRKIALNNWIVFTPRHQK